MSTATVFKLPPGGPDPITDILDGWTVVAGQPTMTTWVLHTSADGSMYRAYGKRRRAPIMPPTMASNLCICWLVN